MGTGAAAQISANDASAAFVGTDTRTRSHPASARARTWVRVASVSAVSVDVIDWTTTGAPPPKGTPPMDSRRVALRGTDSVMKTPFYRMKRTMSRRSMYRNSSPKSATPT